MKNLTTATASPATACRHRPGCRRRRTAPAPGGARLPRASPSFSNPLLFNNIFWDNRAGTRVRRRSSASALPGDATPIDALGYRVDRRQRPTGADQLGDLQTADQTPTRQPDERHQRPDWSPVRTTRRCRSTPGGPTRTSSAAIMVSRRSAAGAARQLPPRRRFAGRRPRRGDPRTGVDVPDVRHRQPGSTRRAAASTPAPTSSPAALRPQSTWGSPRPTVRRPRPAALRSATRSGQQGRNRRHHERGGHGHPAGRHHRRNVDMHGIAARGSSCPAPTGSGSLNTTVTLGSRLRRR